MNEKETCSLAYATAGRNEWKCACFGSFETGLVKERFELMCSEFKLNRKKYSDEKN